MRGVAQQYLYQLRGGVSTIDLSFESLLYEEGNPAAVVDMRVGQEDGVYIRRTEGKLLSLVPFLVRALVRAAID